MKHIPSPMQKEHTWLSRREREVAYTLAEGLSYQDTAEALHVSLNTVRFHVKNIYRKLDVHSKAQVIRMVLKGEL